MKKHQLIASLALLIVSGCSKESANYFDNDLSKSAKSNVYVLNGIPQGKSTYSTAILGFYSNSTSNGNFVTGCLPSGKHLLKQGSFGGTITGYGKIIPSLSPYEFVSCQELPIDPPNVGEPLMYAMVAVGKLALSTRDYCTINFRGNVYPWYYTEFGYYGGLFIGTAVTESGVGKLKGLDGKIFEIYSGSSTGPTINLETGTIRLAFNEKR